MNRTIDNDGVFQSRSKIGVTLIQLLLPTAVVCGGMALGLHKCGLVLEKQSVAFPFTSVAAVVCTAQTADMAGRKWLRLAGRSTGTGAALVVLGVRLPTGCVAGCGLAGWPAV